MFIEHVVEGVSELHMWPIGSFIIFLMSSVNTTEGFTSVYPAFGQSNAFYQIYYGLRRVQVTLGYYKIVAYTVPHSVLNIQT